MFSERVKQEIEADVKEARFSFIWTWTEMQIYLLFLYFLSPSTVEMQVHPHFALWRKKEYVCILQQMHS